MAIPCVGRTPTPRLSSGREAPSLHEHIGAAALEKHDAAANGNGFSAPTVACAIDRDAPREPGTSGQGEASGGYRGALSTFQGCRDYGPPLLVLYVLSIGVAYVFARPAAVEAPELATGDDGA